MIDVPDQELLQGVTGTLEFFNVDGDGEAVAASGAVTVTITRADGTAVATGAATTADPDVTGRYTYTLSAANAASLDLLTAVWTDAGDSSTATTRVEIVGGYLFTLAEMRAAYGELANAGTPTLIEIRRKVTQEVEWICDRSFTPRFRRVTVDGSGDVSISVPDNDLRSVSAVTVDGTAYTAGELAALHLYDRRIDQDAGAVWPVGQLNTVVAYSFGLSRPDPSLKGAALARCRHLKNAALGGIPDRATKMHVDALGQTFELDTAGRYKTGNPEIDAVYSRWSLRTDGDGNGPAWGQVDLNPQAWSLFHGGRR